jgi:hypothetical protein
MASTINASLSSGIVQTADTSGILQLQSNGTTISSGSTAGMSVLGTNTNDNASSGFVGETVISTAIGISLTTSNSNATSISLTAGDWDVTAYASGAGASGTCTAIKLGISTTSATFGTTGLDWVWNACDVVNGPSGATLPLRRYSLSTTTTIYAVMATSAGTNTNMNCTLVARRRR